MVFVDLAKALDRVPKKAIWWALRRNEVVEKAIKAIKEKHMNVKTSVKVESIGLESFDEKFRVHQRSALSSLLFATVIDEVKKDIRESVVKELLYAVYLILLGDG